MRPCQIPIKNPAVSPSLSGVFSKLFGPGAQLEKINTTTKRIPSKLNILIFSSIVCSYTTEQAKSLLRNCWKKYLEALPILSVM